MMPVTDPPLQTGGETMSNIDENPEIDELMRRSRKGDHKAFARLFDLRRGQLAGEASRKLGQQMQSRLDASDVVQEVFLEADRRLEEMADNEIPMLAWLRLLLKQKIVDMRRRHLHASKRSMDREQSIENRVSDLDSIAQQLVASLTSPSIRIQRDELQLQVRQVLSELSILDRQVLVLRHFECKSNREIASELGLSINAASNRYVRALKRFKSILDSAGLSGSPVPGAS